MTKKNGSDINLISLVNLKIRSKDVS
uniref:Uncharacterized protein n=1 Tax=Arundo donax TaxID=35708 RepID=A0A0A9CEZ5_ARUDO